MSQAAPRTWKRTLYIAFFAQLISAMGFSLIFPFLPLYVQALGTTTGISIDFLAGMVFSAQALTMMIASPIWGSLADQYGRKLMVERAMFGGTLLLFLMAFVTSAEQLVLLRAIQGFITGTVSANNALVASTAPRERMGYAMGLLQVGQWSGVAMGPLIGGVLADAYGYAIPHIFTAILLGIGGILIHFGIDEEFQPANDQKLGRKAFVAEWRHVLSMKGVIVTYSLRFLTALMRSMIVPIAPLFIQTLMLEASGVSTITGVMIGISSAAATATGIYLGRLGDRIGHRRIVIVSAVAAGLLLIPQALVTETWQLIVLYGLTGAASGGLVAAPSALLAHFTDPGEEGAVYGIDNSIVAGGRALAPLMGSGLAIILGYRGVFVVAGLLMLLVVMVAFQGLPQRRLTPA
ncbi:MAG: MFS transporter [Anaerolineaceae bacterium]|nr:MFS transporter [Anaerolineaceae bacterium]